MVRRPLFVTIAGCIVLLWGLNGVWRVVIVLLAASKGPLVEMILAVGPLLAFYAFEVAINLICGACILRGVNWARMLWTLWCVFHLVLSSLLSQDKNLALPLVGVQFFIILVLFLPRANDYFLRDRNA